jgi:hypothetical protein
MIRSRTALAVSAGGVALFMLSLYGLARDDSPTVAVVGLGLVLVGLVLLGLSLRGSALGRPPVAVLLIALPGVVLHVYEQAAKSSEFSPGWLLWALVPYVLCIAASTVPACRAPAIAGVTVVLMFDLYVHDAVFLHPRSSTAALAMIFAPLWSALVFAPVTMMVAWAVVRWRTAGGPRPPRDGD